MTWALRHLGLDTDADERTIKRAYASKLKTTRPDTDPEGFQALNEAYQAALTWVHSKADATMPPLVSPPYSEIEKKSAREEEKSDTHAVHFDAAHRNRDDASVHLQAVTSRQSSPDQGEAPADTSRFAPDTFLATCTALAVRSRDGELLRWLNAQPALWSLQHKTQVGGWLLRHLQEQRPPIEARRFDILAEFFGFLDLNSGYDPYAIHRLHHRLHLTWEVQTEQLRALAQRAGMDGNSIAAGVRQTQRILKQLRRPLSTTQALLAGLMPLYPSAVRRFLHRLNFGNIEDLPVPIDPGQVAFWDAAGDRSRFSIQRLLIGFTRCLAYAAIGALLISLVKAMSPDAIINPTTVLIAALTLLSAMLSGWLTWVGAQACLDWQSQAESETQRFARLRWAFIPMLALLAPVLDWGPQWSGLAAGIAMAAFVLAWHRYRQRNGSLFGIAARSPLLFALAMAVLLAVIVASLDRAAHALVVGMSALAMALWTIDLRRQRAATPS
jgi:hypothetical protein